MSFYLLFLEKKNLLTKLMGTYCVSMHSKTLVWAMIYSMKNGEK